MYKTNKTFSIQSSKVNNIKKERNLNAPQNTALKNFLTKNKMPTIYFQAIKEKCV